MSVFFGRKGRQGTLIQRASEPLPPRQKSHIASQRFRRTTYAITCAEVIAAELGEARRRYPHDSRRSHRTIMAARKAQAGLVRAGREASDV